VAVVFVTGMSGTGKSAALAELVAEAIASSTRTTAVTEIDTRASLEHVIDALERIAAEVAR